MGDYRSDEQASTPKGCLRFFAYMLIGFILLLCGMYFAVDNTCRANANTWLEDYPDSEFVRETYTFLRPFGIGETIRVLYSADAPNTVRSWYREADRARDDRGLIRNEGVSQTRWQVIDAENEGSQIALQSECARQWVLWYPN
jgi:hypothetical protein